MARQFEPKRYWENRVRRAYVEDGIARPRLGIPFNRWTYRVRRRAFLRTMRPFVRERAPERVLDVGSGTGFYLDRWEELGATSVTASDIAEEAVGELRERRLAQEAVRLDIGAAELDLPAESFDYVSVIGVFFHIVDDERFQQALANVAQLLRPGGFLVFTDDFVQHGVRPKTRKHKVVRPLSQTEASVEAGGLEVVGRRPVFFLMSRPLDSESRLLQRWWIALRDTLTRWPGLGRVLGAVLYPIEVLLGRFRREGPGTELMVCRKPATSGSIGQAQARGGDATSAASGSPATS